MLSRKDIFLKCDDGAETIVFSKYDDGTVSDYEFAIEDSYCGAVGYMGIIGRLKRAWRAFWGKPIVFNAVYCGDEERMKKFLRSCLNLMD